MTTIEQIKKELINAGPGTIITIEGYENSQGEVRDIRAELLDSSAYWTMQREDLRILREADVENLIGEAGIEVPQVADILAARDQMIEAKASAIGRHESGYVEKRGPAYEYLGGSLERLPADDMSVYMHRLKDLGEIEEPKPAKGGVPRAKQYLQRRLELPSRRYMHSLKFTKGKFKELRVEKMVEGSPLAANA